jgi:hypothetical protein
MAAFRHAGNGDFAARNRRFGADGEVCLSRSGMVNVFLPAFYAGIPPAKAFASGSRSFDQILDKSRHFKFEENSPRNCGKTARAIQRRFQTCLLGFAHTRKKSAGTGDASCSFCCE